MRRKRPDDDSQHAGRAAPRSAERDALELREGQLRGILDTASEGIVTADESQTIVMANQAAADMFRCSVGDLIGAPVDRLLPERFRMAHRRWMSEFGAQRTPVRRMNLRASVVGLRADGEEFAVDAGISQVHVDGQHLYTVILRDLTDAHRAAEALRTSERMLVASFEASTVGMAQIDPATRRFVAVNAALCELTGYAEAELLQMNPDSLNHPQDRLDLRKYAGLLQGSAPYREDKRIVRRDGAVIWVQVTGSVVRGDDGRALRVVGMIQDITARRAAEAALHAREARQAFLVRLNDGLRALDDPQAIAFEAASLLGRFVGAARVGYAEDDGDEKSLSVLTNYVDGVPEATGPYRYRDYGPMVIDELRAGRTIVRRDVVSDSGLTDEGKALFAAGGVGAVVHVPLLRESRLRAVFFVHARTPRDWTADEVALFEDVAQRIRADIDRARAEAALRARESRQAFLVRLNDHLRVLDDPRAIVCEAACLLGEFIDAARVGYAEDDGNGETVTAGPGYVRGVPSIEGRHRHLDYGSAVAEAARAGRTLVRPDIPGEPGLTPAQKAAYAAVQVAAAVNVPLYRDTQLQAVLYVHATAPRRWTSDEVSLIEDVAQRLRADLARARAQSELRDAKAKLEAALESMTDAVLMCDARGIVLEVNAAFAAFHRFGSKADCPRTLAGYPPLLEVTLADGSIAPLGQWALPRALRGEAATNVEYGLRRKDTGERWTASFSFSPIRDAQGRIVGAVAVGRDLTELKRMHAALQDSHAELQRLIDAQDKVAEQERLRIARELHDDLQQGLAAIAMQAAAIRQRLHGRDAQADHGLASIGRIGEQVIASTRRIIQDLRPQILEDLGLGSALEALASQFTQRVGIRCTVDVGGLSAAEQARAAPVASCLYRVAQEALNNVAKHANAQSVRITLQDRGGDLLSLSIADDGVGLPAARAPSSAAFGLLGMRERVRAAGGQLRVRSPPGQGTTVEVEVPLPRASAPPSR